MAAHIPTARAVTMAAPFSNELSFWVLPVAIAFLRTILQSQEIAHPQPNRSSLGVRWYYLPGPGTGARCRDGHRGERLRWGARGGAAQHRVKAQAEY